LLYFSGTGSKLCPMGNSHCKPPTYGFSLN
jgi:hypothetical protein